MSDRVLIILIVAVAVSGTVTGFLAAVLVARGRDVPPFLALATGTAIGALATLLLRVELGRKKNGNGNGDKKP